MDGLLSLSSTWRSYLPDIHPNKSTADNAAETSNPAAEDDLPLLSTPSNSWQPTIYPSEDNDVDAEDALGGFSTQLAADGGPLPSISFDAFLESGYAANEFEWDLEEARTLTISDIRHWRGDPQETASTEERDARVVERRTKLWRMVLAQQHYGLDYSAMRLFTVPTTPDTRESPYLLRPDAHGTHWRVPRQQIHISPYTIPSELADIKPASTTEFLARLNDIFGIDVKMDGSLEQWLRSRIEGKMDLGLVYGYLRPWWRKWVSANGCAFSSVLAHMGRRREEDARIRFEAAEPDPGGAGGRSVGTSPKIVNTRIPPRRVWDLYSNRVLPFCALASPDVPEHLWAVSHCWVAESERGDVWTSINGFQWPVPVPNRTTLDRIRIELLNMGAEYVFLDVLCLRQTGEDDDERLRGYEWRLDVPTLGYVYRYDRYQTTVVYFNGLGRPFDVRRQVLNSTLHWFNRAWTLQETNVNWLPGGLRASIPGQAEGLYFASRLQEAQHALGIPTMRAPSFATLLQAMHNRPGYADKKPYDRVAALAYLLPSSRPAVYSKRWSSAEEAWTSLVESLTGRERLALLLYEPPGEDRVLFRMLHVVHRHWRPSWDEVMLYPKLVPEPLDCPYAEEEGLQGPVTFEWQKYYVHSAYVVEGCRTAGAGYITMPREDRDGNEDPASEQGGATRRTERFLLESKMDFSETIPFTMVGIGRLEYWVAGARECTGTVDLGDGRTAFRLHKFAVGRMPDISERERVQGLQLGSKKLVAYLEPEF